MKKLIETFLSKKIFIKGILVCLCPLFSLQANKRFTEIRASYFYSTDSLFRDIYSGTGLYNIEINIKLQKRLLFWSSLGLLYTSGFSIGEGDKTKLFALPLGLGIKYLFRLNCVKPYLGIGIAPLPFSYIYNNSPFVSRHQYGWGIGGVVKSGLMFKIKKNILLDCFLDYTYLYANFSHKDKEVIRRQVNISGISAGLGFAFLF